MFIVDLNKLSAEIIEVKEAESIYLDYYEDFQNLNRAIEELDKILGKPPPAILMH